MMIICIVRKHTMIFIDADAYIGIFVENDFHHKTTINISNKLTDKLVTSSEVVAEVTTKLSYFTTHKLANEFLKNILFSETKIEYMNPIRLKVAAEMFCKQSSKRVSLTDCINMTICRELGIKNIFSFDKHYQKNGFILLK